MARTHAQRMGGLRGDGHRQLKMSDATRLLQQPILDLITPAGRVTANAVAKHYAKKVSHGHESRAAARNAARRPTVGDAWPTT